MNAPTLHTPLQVGSCRLANRIVALPVFTGYADPDGRVSALLLNHYRRLAAGGAAIVVVANVAVAAEGVTSAYNLRIDDDRYIPGLANLAAAIKDQGALACIQLNHAGRFALTDQPRLASPAEASHLVHHVSALKGFMHAFPFEQRFGLTRAFVKRIVAWRRAMTPTEMAAVINQFGRAAERALAAGFDMIELHGANGYLLCEFLSPATNRRTSGLGGSLGNRAAFPLAVVNALKRRLPPPVPLGYRLLLEEWVPGGLEPREAIAFACMLEEAGIGYLSAAAGTFNSIFRPPVVQKMARPAYLREAMKRLTDQVSVPTVISGRITTPAQADELLQAGTAHLIGLGRALRVDPDWVKKSRHPASTVTPCLNCNACLKRVILDQGFICRCWPRTLQQRTLLDHLLLTRNDRSLWVVADGGDGRRFTAALPELLPADGRLAAAAPPTILFLDAAGATHGPAADRDAFLAWVQERVAAGGHPPAAVGIVATAGPRTPDTAIEGQLAAHHLGMVLIGRDPEQAWQERLCYRLRHKVIGLISPHAHLRRIAVPIDFSDASLLVLAFCRRAFMHRADVRVRFLHVLRGDSREAARRWLQLKRAVGLDPGEPLKMISSTEPVAAAVLDDLTAAGDGTVVMGKRGLSGIKRLLLGRVSRGVLRGSGEASLFLVD